MSPLVVIFVTVFIDLLGFGIIIPLLPFYAETFGASALGVGMLMSSYSVMQFLFAPVWGRLSDRIGRRPVILLGLVGSFVSYLIFGLATSLTLLFASRIAAGIAGANIPTAQAFIADTTGHEDRAKGMGLIGAAFGLGFIFGPAAGGFLSRWGYSTPAFFASGLSLANFCLAWFTLPESRPPRAETGPAGSARFESRWQTFTRARATGRLGLLFVVYFIVVSAFSGFEATFALFSERQFGFTASTIGYMFAFVGVVLSLVQGVLVGRAVRRFGEQRLLPIAILIIGLSMLAIPFVPSVTMLTATLGVLAFGIGFHTPSVMSLISRMTSAEDQGAVLGASQSLASLARIVGPAWGGYTFDRYGVAFPYLTAAVLMFAACGLVLLGLRGYQPPQPGEIAARVLPT